MTYMYIETKIRKMQLPIGVIVWCNNSSKDNQEVVKNVAANLTKDYTGRNLVKCVSVPFMSNYKKELEYMVPWFCYIPLLLLQSLPVPTESPAHYLSSPHRSPC